MNIVVTPSKLAGTVRVPASKSVTHRLLICAALADGPTRVAIGATNKDIEATADCLRALGAAIVRDGKGFLVAPIHASGCMDGRGGVAPPAQSVSDQGHPTGGATPPLQDTGLVHTPMLDCGESGSTLRFLLPVAAALAVPTRFTGRGRLPQRPNAPLVEALRVHGSAIDSDLLPMNVMGPLSGGRWTLPGNVSSQYITGLLFALPLLKEDSEIILTTKLESASYVDLTFEALRRFGIAVERTASGWRVPGGQRYRSPGEVTVEGDWSAAAFWLAANALGAEVRCEGLNHDSAQGDRAVTKLLGQASIDVSNVPDLVPALAVAAASLPQTTVITGAERLRLKESDRLATVAALLATLGHDAEVTPDGLILRGGPPKPIEGAIRTVDGANDHRIVMAAAVAAAFADRPVRITGAEAVEKSYPDFFRDFIGLGGKCHVERAGQ